MMDRGRMPARVTPPGRIIERELEAREWTQRNLAEITGRPLKTINKIITGKKQITCETAIELAAAFETGPEFWNNLQANYNLFLARKIEEDKTIRIRSRIHSLVPYNEMVKRGYLTETEDVAEQERQVRSFFGIKDIFETPVMYASFRLSKGKNISKPSQYAWLRIVKTKASQLEAAAFNPDRLPKLLEDLRPLLRRQKDIADVPILLREYGIRLVYEKYFKNSKINGAVVYTDEGAPVIGLSCLNDRIDNFWFTLVHELGHIRYDRNIPHLDEDDGSERDEGELRADRFARDFLIPPRTYSRIIAGLTPPYIDEESILEAARECDIHPGILIGRLHAEKVIPFSHFRKHLAGVSRYLG